MGQNQLELLGAILFGEAEDFETVAILRAAVMPTKVDLVLPSELTEQCCGALKVSASIPTNIPLLLVASRLTLNTATCDPLFTTIHFSWLAAYLNFRKSMASGI